LSISFSNKNGKFTIRITQIKRIKIFQGYYFGFEKLERHFQVKNFSRLCFTEFLYSNKNFVLEFGCKLRVRIKNPSQKLLATIKYQFSKEADFELEIVAFIY